MNIRPHTTALALAAFVSAAVLTGIGQLAEPGAPTQLLVQAVQALAGSPA